MQEVKMSLLRLVNGELCGPLAPVVPPDAVPNGLLPKALRTFSKLTSGGFELLGLRAGLDGAGDFWCAPTGLLARSMGRKMAENVTKAIRGKGRPLLTRDGQLIYTLFQPPVPSVPLAKVLASRLQTDRTGRPFPATHTMQITTACQCDCVHCSAARFHDKTRKILTTEECKSFIRQSLDLGVVNVIFTGGEPLLRPDLYELIASVDKDEAISMIFTNGLLLNKENVQKLHDADLFSLMVSLDTTDPTEHNQMRRADGCWEKAVEGIRNCLDAGLLCGISTYATPERVHNGKVMAMIELGRKLGVQEITVFDVVPTGRLLQKDKKELLNEVDKQALIVLQRDINSRLHEGYPHVVTQAQVNGPTGAGCYASWYQIYSTAFGDVTPCDFTPLSFGNIRDDALTTIYRRMKAHPAYCEHSDHCRMQDESFREKYIDSIPAKGPFPFPVEQLLNGCAQVASDAEESMVGSSVGIKA